MPSTNKPSLFKTNMPDLIKKVLIAAVFALPLGLLAQADHSQHGKHTANPSTLVSDAMGEAVVKKVDHSKSTITLAHGPMNGMPAMTMTYKVKDAAWLKPLQAGQKVRFATNPADGGMTVAHIELIK